MARLDGRDGEALFELLARMSFASADRAVLEVHVSAGRCFDMVITHGRRRIVRRLSRRKVLRIWKKPTVKIVLVAHMGAGVADSCFLREKGV